MSEERPANHDDPEVQREPGEERSPKLSRRMFLGGAAAVASMAATPVLRSAAASVETASSAALQGPDGLQVEVRPYGRSRSEMALLRDELEATVLDPYIPGRHRWLSFKRDAARRSTALLPAPDVFTATVYDYDHGRTLDVSGSLDDLSRTRVSTSSRQPRPVEEEFEEAVGILRDHPTLGSAIREGHLLPYQPMPPLLPGDDSRRAVAVGLYAPDPPVTNTTDPHRLAGVDLHTGEVIVDHPVATSGGSDCEAPRWHWDCPFTGRTGQAEITVTRDGQELWRLVVVRPSESSGTNGSGAELRHVSYRGRSVMVRAHVPILNVIYGTDYIGENRVRCGPTYRDWLDQESCFEAQGTDIADGVRLCDEEPATIMRTGSDEGDFRGAAVYLDGSDVVITSELTAGWYRYITEWKLHDDGNITPRFGFSAVRNPCTCRHHVHHAYWRFDFAADELDDHRVEEHNATESLTSPAGWRTLDREESRDRDPERSRYWRITHRTTGAGYQLIPGRGDAVADVYGAGDTWFLTHHPDEIDDGQGFTTNPAESRARLDLFADGEQLDGRDVVAWYAGHWHHEHGDDGDWVGPRLRQEGM